MRIKVIKKENLVTLYKKLSKRLFLVIAGSTLIIVALALLFIPFFKASKSKIVENQQALSVTPTITPTVVPVHDGLIVNNGESVEQVQRKDNVNLPDIIDKKIPDFTPITIPIFTYHHIRPLDSVASTDILGKNLSVSPANFKNQMNDFIKLGYTSVDYRDLLDYMQKKTQLPKKPAMINFDDGYTDVYTNAFPILEEDHLKASFAIITNDVGKFDYMNWDQIKDLKKNNFEIVSHTVNHPDLSKISSQKLVYELKESKRVLDTQLNQNTFVIVYPAGKYNDQTKLIASQQGYLFGRSFTYGKVVSKDTLLDIPAIRMKDGSKIM